MQIQLTSSVAVTVHPFDPTRLALAGSVALPSGRTDYLRQIDEVSASREESVDTFGDIRTLAIPDSDSEFDSELVRSSS
jgi:hypothetical protein